MGQTWDLTGAGDRPRHDVSITKTVLWHGGDKFYARCTCGWQSPRMWTRSGAQLAGDEHGLKVG